VSIPLLNKLEAAKAGRLGNAELAGTIADIGHSDLIQREDVHEVLIAFLSHPIPDVRAETVSALAFHGVSFTWGSEPGRTLRLRLMNMANKDPDHGCRRMAASGLGSFFRDTNDAAVATLLAGIVQNPMEEDQVRAFAYCALLSVQGIPIPQQPSPLGLTIGANELQTAADYLARLTKNRRH
jgi:hypothetical protein